MQCDVCQEKIEDNDKFDYLGKTMCEDCYIAALHRPRSCDPAAVSSAVHSRKQMGHTGTQGMTELQKNIYEYIKEKGKVEKDKLAEIFNLSPLDAEKQFAIMRHCELLKGMKEGNTIYITTF
ncbi:conserved hypothetical protein [Desulfofarcimen acetoxidans DSM 771]|jgi:hypothetical protein|uniref:Uncharacterized protein n=1 Tax=Desulfofarcimen acetoxidans (strain ATCC 49208 / DSM 771 / KCTC 5769 / VKM B-1644 / 5575) TaxID=485916 RepID=C8W021_DESAS|nr:hypothetical protein [Desulfofarcimen acetoxidans]ACV64989.1 conserved hypothetical protein [Desulfofarcimen acetoxidans DSM 771]